MLDTFTQKCARDNTATYTNKHTFDAREMYITSMITLVREPVIDLIKWLRPKGLKLCSYGELCAELFSNCCFNMSLTKYCCCEHAIYCA